MKNYKTHADGEDYRISEGSECRAGSMARPSEKAPTGRKGSGE